RRFLELEWKEKRSRHIVVEPNITFNQLIDEIYESTEIDKNIFDINIVPIVVKKDRDMMAFIYWQKKDNIPLYVTLVRKS
ncbi:hypothetical protein TorRG33x02_008950, partial [Trema orientale]